MSLNTYKYIYILAKNVNKILLNPACTSFFKNTIFMNLNAFERKLAVLAVKMPELLRCVC